MPQGMEERYQIQEQLESKTMWSLMPGSNNRDMKCFNFRVATESKKYKSRVEDHLLLKDYPICPSTLGTSPGPGLSSGGPPGGGQPVRPPSPPGGGPAGGPPGPPQGLGMAGYDTIRYFAQIWTYQYRYQYVTSHILQNTVLIPVCSTLFQPGGVLYCSSTDMYHFSVISVHTVVCTDIPPYFHPPI